MLGGLDRPNDLPFLLPRSPHSSTSTHPTTTTTTTRLLSTGVHAREGARNAVEGLMSDGEPAHSGEDQQQVNASMYVLRENSIRPSGGALVLTPHAHRPTKNQSHQAEQGSLSPGKKRGRAGENGAQEQEQEQQPEHESNGAGEGACSSSSKKARTEGNTLGGGSSSSRSHRVKLRGLPEDATVEEIQAFLGPELDVPAAAIRIVDSKGCVRAWVSCSWVVHVCT